MKSKEILDKKRRDEMLDGGCTTSAVAAWVWKCTHCGQEHTDPKFTKHGKYRECGKCGKGNIVILYY